MAAGFLSVAVLTAAVLGAESPSIRITDRMFHLGDNEKPEWKDHTSIRPTHKTEVEIEFDSEENQRKFVLEIQAGGVLQDWRVKINDKSVGELKKVEELTPQYFDVPRATLKTGKNKLIVSSDREGDDIYVGKAVLHDRPMRDFLGHARVRVLVKDADTGENIPSRLTITKLVDKKEKEKYKDEEGKEKEREVTRKVEELVDLILDESRDFAVRKGVLYTKKGKAVFDLPPGPYNIYATRGFEYGVHAETLKLGRLEERDLELEIRREVDTTGYLAADTHIHTKTYSKHGDINLEERVITIAGEGVELAVATDHNHHTDYGPTMEKMEVRDQFTSIVGNEVTTDIGHFNIFPTDRRAEPPNHDHSDWVKLIQEMRKSSGVRVIIVNHPRRTLGRKSPFEMIRLNPVSGEAHSGPQRLGLDAVEILNGKTLEDNRLLTLKDWLGILNRGHRIFSVAASDSHAVNEIVGQARTYVASSTDDPRKIKIDEVCSAFLAGRLLVSLGLLTNMEVNGRHRVGDLISAPGVELDVKVTVQAPSWSQADRVALYLDGIEVASQKIEATSRPVKFSGGWTIPTPRHDAHLVAVASGPAITAPYWPIAGGEKKYVMGSTNPIWIDGDGDGKFTSAFEYARAIVSRSGLTGEEVQRSLSRYDAAVHAQFASIARARIEEDAQGAYQKILAEADRKLDELLDVADGGLKKGFKEYLAVAPKVEVRTRRDVEDEAARLKKEEEDRDKRRKEAEKKRREERRKRKKV